MESWKKPGKSIQESHGQQEHKDLSLQHQTGGEKKEQNPPESTSSVIGKLIAINRHLMVSQSPIWAIRNSIKQAKTYCKSVSSVEVTEKRNKKPNYIFRSKFFSH